MRNGMRRVLALLMVLLAALSALTASLGVWTNTNIFDSERFAAQGAEVLAEKDVADTLARHLTEQLTVVVTSMTNRNPDGRAVRLIKGSVEKQVSSALRSEKIAPVAHAALLRTHQEVLQSIEGKHHPITLNLLPLTTLVLNDLLDAGILPSWVRVPTFSVDGDPERQALELARVLRIEIPSDFGRIVLVGENPSQAAQNARRVLAVFHDVVLAALIATGVLALGALITSPRRERTLIHLGVAASIAWVVGVLAVDAAKASVEGLVASADRSAVSIAMDVFLSTWTDLSVRLILIGVALAAVGILLNLRSGLVWTPVLVGFAVAATGGLSIVWVGLGVVIAAVGSLAIKASSSGKPSSDTGNIRSAD